MNIDDAKFNFIYKTSQGYILNTKQPLTLHLLTIEAFSLRIV